MDTPDQFTDPHGQDDVDWDLLRDNLAMTVTERIQMHQRAHEMAETIREAGARKYGFDPDEGQ